MGDFGSKQVKSRPTKDRGNDPVPGNNVCSQKENNAIVNNAVDEILLHKNQKLSTKKKLKKNVDSDFYENKLYLINNTNLDYKK